MIRNYLSSPSPHPIPSPPLSSALLKTSLSPQIHNLPPPTPIAMVTSPPSPSKPHHKYTQIDIASIHRCAHMHTDLHTYIQISTHTEIAHALHTYKQIIVAATWRLTLYTNQYTGSSILAHTHGSLVHADLYKRSSDDKCRCMCA